MPALRYIYPLLVVSPLSLAILSGLLGCQQKANESVNEPISANSSANDADISKSVDNVKSKNTADNNDLSQTQTENSSNHVNAHGNGTTINYDMPSWDSAQVKHIALNDITAIHSVLGKPKSTDEDSLDFDSNPANKYRYMPENEPYLDIVNSANYLEIDWYHANANDTNSEKQASINHAKKAHLLARHLMGKDGGNLIKQMLSGQTIKDRHIGGVSVALAKCQFYSCMLVLNKQNSQ